MALHDTTFVAFSGHARLSAGDAPRVAADLRRRLPAGAAHADGVLIFGEQTGRQVDWDLSGDVDAVVARVGAPAVAEAAGPRARGRPKLGVVGKEVSLLPRHWAWLSEQRGGASAAIRRLVDEARAKEVGSDQTRLAAEAVGRFLWVVAGNLEGFEEVSRALFAPDFARCVALMAPWPVDVRVQAEHMLAIRRDPAVDAVDVAE